MNEGKVVGFRNEIEEVYIFTKSATDSMCVMWHLNILSLCFSIAYFLQ